MKKGKLLTITLTLSLMLLATGCGNKESGDKTTTAQASAGTEAVSETKEDKFHTDEEVYPIRMCTRMKALDLGHNKLTNLNFLNWMPGIEVLIVTPNRQLTDIGPIANCKNLVYLEAFNIPITDLSPLAAHKGLKVSELKKTYPQYFIAKNKIQLSDSALIEKILSELKRIYAKENINDIDGVKINFEANKTWVHLRKSNTEPIIRIYSEASTPEAAEALGNEVIAVAQKIIG